MEIILLIALAGVVFWFFIMKTGNIDFWKLAQKHPEEAYSFFVNNNNFIVFDHKPVDGFGSSLPPGDWDGPFKLRVPSKDMTVTIYGKSPEYVESQNEFTRLYS